MLTSRRLAVASLLTLAATTYVAAQDLAAVRRLHDAGKYQEAIEAIGKIESPEPRLRYLEGQCYERLGDAEGAARVASQLGSGGPVWQSIARSATALRGKQAKEALAAATQAVSQDGSAAAEAHYQLGLALTLNQDFAKAATEFDKASELDPQWAYPRYYAGMSYSRVKRTDLLAARFEAFLKLAPNAPERPQIESTMRTIRGR